MLLSAVPSLLNRLTHRPDPPRSCTMRALLVSLLVSLLLAALAVHTEALKCYTCVASSEEECNRQGSASCPQYADACSTITGPSPDSSPAPTTATRAKIPRELLLTASISARDTVGEVRRRPREIAPGLAFHSGRLPAPSAGTGQRKNETEKHLINQSFAVTTNTVMKSCSYKSFCDKANNGNSGAKMECCFSDDCNGPHKGRSQGVPRGAAGPLASSPALLLGALAARLIYSAVLHLESFKLLRLDNAFPEHSLHLYSG
ncbi:hypothetical protein COCON_G00159900 [Conger conger]|uniref:UPAR/Ly6 domain-containing protein n=1 Tax=Conger conger TaxID=82655 RepID=A0A9Q1D9Y0_CONCO|nr:hypothetical protein COCON_G00159900 [Conger conger]